ncbi:MAG TPA: DUF4058 family protein, partial [Isosphaeraceae bacterium]
VWAPPRPTRAAPLSFADPDLFEVQVYTDATGPRVVAAIELISPANKDRPAHRRAFAVRCASYLQAGISLVLVDVVTQRSGDLHDDLLRLLDVAPEPSALDLYAGAYRITLMREVTRLEFWLESLAVGSILPVLPLWISPDQCLPLNLEQAYVAACASSRIG